MKRYTEDHEWLEQDGEFVVVGITSHAADLLGDLVYIELPEVGSYFDAHSDCAIVESVKAASDVYCPIDGTIVQVNEALFDAPDSVNDDPDNTWLFKIEAMRIEDFDSFLTEEAYQDLCN